jgi:hypothetical protein
MTGGWLPEILAVAFIFGLIRVVRLFVRGRFK